MRVTSIKTPIITQKNTLFHILDEAIPSLQEKSIVAVTSKIVAITQGRLVAIDNADKDELIKNEAAYFLPRSSNPYGVSLTITNGTLIATAGIDESNADGKYVLWPENPQKAANEIRAHIKERLALSDVGVIITDSKTTPLRWGVTAIAIGYSGFVPVKDYVGTEDLFGRKFAFEKMSIIDNLASAAAVVMGEGAESTPLAVITDLPFVQFVKNDPTKEELKSLRITMGEDLYGPLLKSVEWKKGRGK